MKIKNFFINGNFEQKQAGVPVKWTWVKDEANNIELAKGKDGREGLRVDYSGAVHPHSVLALTSTDEARCALADEIKNSGFGVFELSCNLKAANKESLGKKIIFKTHYVYHDENGNQTARSDFTVGKPVALTEDWQGAIVKFSIAPTPNNKPIKQELKYVAIEFTVAGNEKVSIIVDDVKFDCVCLMDVALLKPDHKLIPQDKTLIGAIRWDIWSRSHTAKENNQLIIEDGIYNAQNEKKRRSVTSPDMMMRTLSYYPDKAPYFVKYEGAQDNGDVIFSLESCYDKTGLTYTYEDVMDDLKVKEHPYIYAVPWEEEAKMAMDAGVDYFGYLYKTYGNTNFGDVLEPAFAHTELNGMLPDGRQMKMFCIMQDNNSGFVEWNEDTTDEEKMASIYYPRRMIYKAMAQSCYLNAHTENGDIPMLHFYNEEYRNLKSPQDLQNYVREAKFFTEYLHKKNPEKYRVVNDIYFVGYTNPHVSGRLLGDAMFAKYLGIDALSRYSLHGEVTDQERKETARLVDEQFDNAFSKKEEKEIGPLMPKGSEIEWQRIHRIAETHDTKPSIWQEVFGESFARFVDRTMKENDSYLECASFMDYIPLLGFGRDVTPRIKVRIAWGPRENSYANRYTIKGTPTEQAEFLRKTLDFALKYKKINPNTVNCIDMYAWNEFDEGGYLQPTLLIGEDGKPVLDKQGNTMKNTAVIEEFAKVVKEFRKKEAEV